MRGAFTKCLLLCGLGLAPTLALAQNDHGNSTKLGTVTLAGQQLVVTKLGAVTAGKEAAFQIDAANPGTKKLADLNVYLWLEDQGASKISAPGKGIVEGDALHFHVTPKAGSAPQRVVVRVREAGKDEKASLPLDGHGHEHAATPHDGVVAPLKDQAGKQVGYLELKLHDDKGDLELWLSKDSKGSEPLDLPVSSTVKVTFVDVDNRVVELKARNAVTNEDEDGKPNLRNGMTNYFIFPLSTKDDSAWLKGAQFQSIVTLSYLSAGDKIVSDEFVLVPHTHADGSHH